MKTKKLKVNINKTKLMVMSREPAVRPQRGRYPCGVCGNVGNNFRCPTCMRGVVAVPRRLNVGEDNLEIVDSCRCLGDVISCGGGVGSEVRDKLYCAWSK